MLNTFLISQGMVIRITLPVNQPPQQTCLVNQYFFPWIRKNMHPIFISKHINHNMPNSAIWQINNSGLATLLLMQALRDLDNVKQLKSNPVFKVLLHCSRFIPYANLCYVNLATPRKKKIKKKDTIGYTKKFQACLVVLASAQRLAQGKTSQGKCQTPTLAPPPITTKQTRESSNPLTEVQIEYPQT